PDGMEWYPAGHLVVWAAILGAAVVVAGMLHFGTDEDSFRASLRSFLERMVGATRRTASDAPASPPSVDTGRIIAFLIAVLPPPSVLGLARTAFDLRGRAARRNSSTHPRT